MRRALAQVQQRIHQWGRAAVEWVVDTWVRHQQRLREDPAYRSAVVAGIAAAISLILPHPAIA